MIIQFGLSKVPHALVAPMRKFYDKVDRLHQEIDPSL